MSGCKPAAPLAKTDRGISAIQRSSLPSAGEPMGAESSDRSPSIVSPGEVAPETIDPADLERKFFATTEAEERGLVAEKLWTLNTVAALTTLYRLLHADGNPEVKMDIISGLINAETIPETREIRWALLLGGLAGNQPSPVRELAASILADAEDPRALSLLHSFANDPDEDVREAIRSALRERREALSP